MYDVRSVYQKVFPQSPQKRQRLFSFVGKPFRRAAHVMESFDLDPHALHLFGESALFSHAVYNWNKKALVQYLHQLYEMSLRSAGAKAADNIYDLMPLF